jgi:hypothetical protein
MKFTLVDLYSFSIAIASVIGWVRFKRIAPAFYPFLYCVWIALVNEILGYFLIYSHHSNAVNNNIYVLLESLLIAWQFRNWGLFRKKGLFIVMLAALFVFWFAEVYFMKGIRYTISYFRIFYSFTIVLMSISVISNLIAKDQRSMLRNSIFLICTGFIAYYTFKVLVGVFWLYGLGLNSQFRMNVVWILIYLNLFANLIYALAVLWMPAKQRFLLPS